MMREDRGGGGVGIDVRWLRGKRKDGVGFCGIRWAGKEGKACLSGRETLCSAVDFGLWTYDGEGNPAFFPLEELR